jgi:hypothetical protein
VGRARHFDVLGVQTQLLHGRDNFASSNLGFV